MKNRKGIWSALQSKAWLARSNDNNIQSLIIVRTPYKKNVQRKVLDLTAGFRILNWVVVKLLPEEEKELLKKFQFDTLYQTEAPKQSLVIPSRGLIARAN